MSEHHGPDESNAPHQPCRHRIGRGIEDSRGKEEHNAQRVRTHPESAEEPIAHDRAREEDTARLSSATTPARPRTRRRESGERTRRGSAICAAPVSRSDGWRYIRADTTRSAAGQCPAARDVEWHTGHASQESSKPRGQGSEGAGHVLDQRAASPLSRHGPPAIDEAGDRARLAIASTTSRFRSRADKPDPRQRSYLFQPDARPSALAEPVRRAVLSIDQTQTYSTTGKRLRRRPA